MDDAGGRFVVDPLTGVVTAADVTLIDYESAQSHIIEVTATSTDGSESTTSVTVNVTDVNEAPVLATPGPVTLSVDESISTSTVIYQADASDIDGDALTYSVSGADADKVTMDPVTGEVRFSESPDYESKPSYVFTVTASDGELSDSADIFLSLNDVAFKPADRNPVENVVVENWRPGSEIGLTLVSDLTGHGEVTFLPAR